MEWNENIHAQENSNRCLQLLRATEGFYKEAAVLVGEQQFMLNKDQLQMMTEAQIYIKTASADSVNLLKKQVESFFRTNYPEANVSFAPAGTIFEKIFSTGQAELVVEYYSKDKQEQTQE